MKRHHSLTLTAKVNLAACCLHQHDMAGSGTSEQIIRPDSADSLEGDREDAMEQMIP